MKTYPCWTLTFRAEGDGPPVAVRVRRLLKAALRTYRLRFLAVDSQDEPESPTPDGSDDDPQTIEVF